MPTKSTESINYIPTAMPAPVNACWTNSGTTAGDMGVSFFQGQPVQGSVHENDAGATAIANGENHFRQVTPVTDTPQHPRALFNTGGNGILQGAGQTQQDGHVNVQGAATATRGSEIGAVEAALNGELLAGGSEGELEAFLWQKDAGSTNKADFKDEVLFRDNIVCIGFLQKNSPIVKVVHGVTVYHGNDAPELKKKLLGRVGEWTEDTTPFLVELPVQKAWDWVKVKYCDDLEAWKNFETASVQNRLSLFRSTGDMAEEEVPYMFVLPPRVALMAIKKECTCLELYLEVLRMEQDPESQIGPEHTELLKKCLMAGGQSQGGGTGAQGNALQDKATAVMNVSKGFTRWSKNNMSAYLGQAPSKKKVVLQTPVQQDPGMRMAVARMEQAADRAEKALQDKTVPKEKGKLLDEHQLASLKGFAGTTDWRKLPALYVVIKDCSDNIDARTKILRGMEKWSKDKGIEIDAAVALSEDLIKNIRAVRPNPFDTVGTSRTTDVIVSNMTCLPKSAAEMEKMFIGESAAGSTEANRTMKEREKQLKGESRRPPGSYFELKLNIATTCALVAVCYGELNELYKNLINIYSLLNSKGVMQHKLKFTELLCRQITWAIYDDMRSYFSCRLMPEDFLKPTIDWPESDMCDIYSNVKNLQPIYRPNFPLSWQCEVPVNLGLMGAYQQQMPLPPAPQPPGSSNEKKKGGGGAGSPAVMSPPPGPSPFVCPQVGDKFAHMHPKIKAAMSKYHSVVRRHGIQWILQKAGVRLDQLPTLDGVVDAYGRSNICWNNITGVCFHGANCKFAPLGHVPGDRLPEGFVDQALALLMPGVDEVVKEVEAKRGEKRPHSAVSSWGHYGPADKPQRR